jgi:hypothetical protein
MVHILITGYTREREMTWLPNFDTILPRDRGGSCKAEGTYGVWRLHRGWVLLFPTYRCQALDLICPHHLGVRCHILGHKLRIDIPCNFTSQSHTEFTRLIDCNEEFDVRVPFAYLTKCHFEYSVPI